MADSVCACEEEFRSVCEGLPVDNEHEGQQYCVLHSPRVDKALAAFEGAIEKKLKDKDFDFRGVYFPGEQSLAAFLPNATFEGTVAFSNATFEEEASFSGATFEGEAHFSWVTFENWADFITAAFKKKAVFYLATFKEGTRFWDLRTFPQTRLSFRAAIAEKPERVSFHTTQLRPSCFIDVDAQKFDFSDVEWFSVPSGNLLMMGSPNRQGMYVVRDDGKFAPYQLGQPLKMEDEIKALGEAWEDIGLAQATGSPFGLRKLQKPVGSL